MTIYEILKKKNINLVELENAKKSYDEILKENDGCEIDLIDAINTIYLFLALVFNYYDADDSIVKAYTLMLKGFNDFIINKDRFKNIVEQKIFIKALLEEGKKFYIPERIQKKIIKSFKKNKNIFNIGKITI